MLSLRVKYRAGRDPLPMEFPGSTSVKETIAAITSQFALPTHYNYALYNPQVDPLSSQAWMSPSDSSITLSSALLKNNDIIELRCEPSQLYILHLPEKGDLELGNIPLDYLNYAKKTVMVDFGEPLHEILPAVLKYFPVRKKEYKNYCILKVQVSEKNGSVVGMLNINISLQEARVQPQGHLLVVPLDYFNRPATSINNPTFQGFVTKNIKKGDKTHKHKKYWFIQKYNILYYYHSKTSSDTDGIIDLEYMTVSERGHELLLSPMQHYPNLLAPISDYYLVPEDGRYKDFFQSVWKHSASGAGKHLFGVSLASLWERKFSGDVPGIVAGCADYIRIYGINTPGIIMENGKPHIVTQLKDDYDMGKEMDLIAAHPDALSVGGLLKEYLRSLPEPLLTYKNYPEFWANREQPERLMRILGLLPGPQQLLIKYLFDFFLELLRHSDANRLTLTAISQTFAPIFLRPRDETSTFDENSVIKILATLIENTEQFTPQPRIMVARKSSSSTDLNLASPPFAVPKNLRPQRVPSLPSFSPIPSYSLDSPLQSPSSFPPSPISVTASPPTSPTLHTPPPPPSAYSPPSSPMSFLAPPSPLSLGIPDRGTQRLSAQISSRFTASMRLTPAQNAPPIPIFTSDPTQTYADQAQAAANAAAAAAADAARAAAAAMALLDSFMLTPDDPDGVNLGAPPPPPPMY